MIKSPKLTISFITASLLAIYLWLGLVAQSDTENNGAQVYQLYLPQIINSADFVSRDQLGETLTSHEASSNNVVSIEETNIATGTTMAEATFFHNEENPEGEDSLSTIPPAQSVTLQYFGYYHGATFLGNFMGEFADHANLVMINSVNSALLAEAQSRGLKVMMDVGDAFFMASGTCNHANGQTTPKMVLRSVADYTARWDHIKSKIIGSNAGTVIAFYTLDEPYWHCASKSDLEKVANTIKASYPSKKIMVTFAEPMVRSPQFAIPQNHDWISFDYYRDFTPIPQLFTIIKNKLSPSQKIMLTADGVAFSKTPPDAQTQLQLIARAHQYFELARANPDTVAGLFVFIWPSVHDNREDLIGVREMPLVAQEYRCIGTYITRGSWCDDTIISTNKLVSSSRQTASAQLTVNSNLNDSWNSRGFAPQWITVDLKNEYPVTRIRLHVEQSPKGNTIHEIWVAGNDQRYQKVTTISGETQSGQLLEHIFAPKRDAIRYVKIQTISSPSWVAWREIQIFGPKLGTLISQGKATSASASLASAPPHLAVNGNTTDGGWNAGDFPRPTQWIQVDLGQSTKLSGLKLYVNQSCNGSQTCNAQHEIWITNPYGTSTFVGGFTGTTSDGQILEKRFWPPLQDVRYVRIVTTMSGSWVSWDEVQLFSSP